VAGVNPTAGFSGFVSRSKAWTRKRKPKAKKSADEQILL